MRILTPILIVSLLAVSPSLRGQEQQPQESVSDRTTPSANTVDDSPPVKANSPPAAAQTQVTILRVQYAKARDLARILEQLPVPRLHLVADERTNSIIVSGADPKQLEQVAELLRALDVPHQEQQPGSADSTQPWPRAASSRFSVDLAASTESTDTLRRAYESREQQARVLAEELRAKMEKFGENHPESVNLRSELRNVVRQAFDDRQRLQRAELTEFARRLESVQRSLEARERVADQIIDRRIEDLLNPSWNWDAELGAARDSRAAATPSSNTVGMIVHRGADQLVEISVGSDDGLRKSETLKVISGSTLLGSIEVIELTPDRAVARIVRENSEMPMRQGDLVVNSLVASGAGGETASVPPPATVPPAKADAPQPVQPLLTTSDGLTFLRTPEAFRALMATHARRIVQIESDIARVEGLPKPDREAVDALDRLKAQHREIQQEKSLAESEFMAQLRLLNLERDQAQHRVEAAKAALANSQRLFAAGFMSSGEFEKTRYELGAAEIQLERAATLIKLYEQAGQDYLQEHAKAAASQPRTAPAESQPSTPKPSASDDSPPDDSAAAPRPSSNDAASDSP